MITRSAKSTCSHTNNDVHDDAHLHEHEQVSSLFLSSLNLLP